MNRINHSQFNKNNSILFKGGKDETTLSDKKTKMNKLVPKTKEVLSEIAKREVPENGSFQKVFVFFDIPETSNRAMLYIEPDATDSKTKRTLSVGVHHKDRDRLTSNFLVNGSNEDIQKFLADETNSAQIIEAINTLSEKTDNFYSSL